MARPEISKPCHGTEISKGSVAFHEKEGSEPPYRHIGFVPSANSAQVAENRESTDRQYALVNRAVELGWSPDPILVTHGDQGQRGDSAEDRRFRATRARRGSSRA